MFVLCCLWCAVVIVYGLWFAVCCCVSCVNCCALVVVVRCVGVRGLLSVCVMRRSLFVDGWPVLAVCRLYCVVVLLV